MFNMTANVPAKLHHIYIYIYIYIYKLLLGHIQILKTKCSIIIIKTYENTVNIIQQSC